MLVFNVVLAYQGLLFLDFLWFFFFGGGGVFFSIRPTNPISEIAFDAKRTKKKGMALSTNTKIIGDVTQQKVVVLGAQRRRA